MDFLEPSGKREVYAYVRKAERPSANAGTFSRVSVICGIDGSRRSVDVTSSGNAHHIATIFALKV